MTFNGNGEIDFGSTSLLWALGFCGCSFIGLGGIEGLMGKRIKSCSFKELGPECRHFAVLGKPRSRLRLP
jgi:hypothetical protein